jgi:O-antigen/teichoic acid export membrane protein
MIQAPVSADLRPDAAAEPRVPALRRLAVHASLWAVGGYAAAQVLRLGGNVVLALVLSPDDFGLMALITVFLQGIQLFSDTGIRPSIIHSARGEDPAFLNTAWTIQAIRGAMLWAAAIALAAPVALFYRQPQLLWLLPVAGVSNLMTGLGSTSLITLDRRLALGRVTVVNLSVRFLQIMITLVWALWSPSVWALVGGTLIGTALRVVASHTLLYDGVLNRFGWDRAAARALFHFGKWVFVGTIIGFLASQLDRLLLGKLVPIGVLGVYSIAAVLAMQPNRVCEELASRVLFPILASVARRDRTSFADALRRSRAVVLPAAVVSTAAVWLLAPTFFEILYRDQYRDAGWMAQLLCVPVWFTILGTTAAKGLFAVGDSRSVTVASLARLLVGGTASLVGLKWSGGLEGFILGFGAGAAAGHVVVVALLRASGIDILAQDLLHTAAVLLVIGAGMLAAPLAASALGASMPPAAVTIASAATILVAASIWALRRVRAMW